VVVQEINLVPKEVMEKQTNLVASSTGVSFVIPLNIKSTIIYIRTQFM